MSIINDALKKARGGEPRPGNPRLGGTDDQAPVQPRQVGRPGSDFSILFLVGSVATGVLVILVVATVWLFSYFEAASDLDQESIISPQIPSIEEPLRGRPPDLDFQPSLAESESSPVELIAPPELLYPGVEKSAETLSSEITDTPTTASRDPREPGESDAPSREDIHQVSRDLRIQGVSLAEGNRRVLIGGVFLAEGDPVPNSSAIRIGEITADYILLRDREGEEVRLRY